MPFRDQRHSPGRRGCDDEAGVLGRLRRSAERETFDGDGGFVLATPLGVVDTPLLAVGLHVEERGDSCPAAWPLPSCDLVLPQERSCPTNLLIPEDGIPDEMGLGADGVEVHSVGEFDA